MGCREADPCLPNFGRGEYWTKVGGEGPKRPGRPLDFGPCLFSAVMIRKDGITRSSLQREWPHHVVLSAHKVRGLENSELVRGFPDGLSVRPLTYSLRREERDFVVFCFAKPEDADTFCEQFGGERLPGTRRP